MFAEAWACSSLLLGFASPLKVSSYRLTRILLSTGIIVIVYCTFLVSPAKPLACAKTHPYAHARIRTSGSISFSCICKERISCHTSNCATLKTKGGYYVWLLVVPFNNLSPHPEIHTQYSVTCQFFVFFDVWRSDTRRKQLKFDHDLFESQSRFEMGQIVFSLKLFFRRCLGFSRVVCSLSSLTIIAEIRVTNMWKTPLIQTMSDDYRYFLHPYHVVT